MRSPGTAGVYRSESYAAKWLAGFPNAFFGHGEVASEEAKVGRPREVAGRERSLG